MQKPLDRLGIRLECDRCTSSAVELGLCTTCGRGYVQRVLVSDRSRPRVELSADLGGMISR